MGKQQALVQGILLLFLIELLGEGVHEGDGDSLVPPVVLYRCAKTFAVERNSSVTLASSVQGIIK